MKTILLNSQAQSPSKKSWLKFTNVQKITLFIIAMSLGVMAFGFITLGFIALFSGIVFQLCHKFYREYLMPSFAIANLKADMTDIVNELG
jgi:hypothetical protein